MKDEAAVLAAQRAVENQAAHSHDRESSDDDDDKELSDDHGGEENAIQTRESKTSEGKPNSQKPNNRAQKRKHHPGIEEIT